MFFLFFAAQITPIIFSNAITLKFCMHMTRFSHILLYIVLVPFLFYSCHEDDNPPQSMELSVKVEDASAWNAKDGSISLEIVAGPPPHIFHWNTGDTTQNISGLGAGDYSVRIVYGPNGASFYETTATVSQPEAVPLTLLFSQTASPAYGKPLGSASVMASGGVPPYTYLWSSGATSSTIEGVFAGTYTVTVTDSGNPFRTITSGAITIEQPAFLCGRDSIRDIDGNLYSTILLDDQCWLGENLRARHKPELVSGQLLPIEGSFCRGLFCENKEGAHYTWHATMNGSLPASTPTEKIQGICPTGWHLPTREMYEQLDKWLSTAGNGGPGFFSGAKMKGPESTSGFEALFTGNWGFGIYTQAPYAGFWSSTESIVNPENARMIYLTQDTPFMNAANQPKGFGFNVRCIKDNEQP